MKLYKDYPVKIIMLGAGGTGGHAAPHLYRLLHASGRKTRLIIADGDIVEQKNLVRQNFIETDLGKNKARVIAERYAQAFGLETEYIPEFIENEDRLYNLLLTKKNEYGYYDHPANEIVILIGCVDNNASRRMCHNVFYRLSNIIYIDSGNGEFSGQVVCGIRRNNHTCYRPIGKVFPDILEENGEDKFPTELSCAEAALSASQSITANIMAATAIVGYVYNLVECGEIDTKYITFSTTNLHMKPAAKTKRKSIRKRVA